MIQRRRQLSARIMVLRRWADLDLTSPSYEKSMSSCCRWWRSHCRIQSPHQQDGQAGEGQRVCFSLYLVSVEWGRTWKVYRLETDLQAVPCRWAPDTRVHGYLWLTSMKHVKTFGLPLTIPMMTSACVTQRQNSQCQVFGEAFLYCPGPREEQEGPSSCPDLSPQLFSFL